MKGNRLLSKVLLLTGVGIISVTFLFFPLMGEAKGGELPFKGVTIRAMMEPHPSTYALQKLVGEFERKTGMKVILEVVPFEQSFDKASLEFSQKSSAYDIIFNDASVVGVGWSNSGYLEPLDNLINDPSIDNSDLDINDLMPKFLDGSRSPVDGKIYGFPLYGESTFLMFRKDIFALLGLTTPDTMSELKLAVKKVSENTDLYGITLRGRRGIHGVYIWRGFMQAFGGRWFDENMKPQLNTPEVIAGTELYAEMLQKYSPPGAVNYGWEENRICFEQGRAASTIDATVNGAFAEDPKISKIVGKVGYAPVPKVKRYGCSSEVHCLFINKFSNNIKASWAFLKWAISKDTQFKAFKIEPHSGITSRSVLLSREFKEKYPTFADTLVKCEELGNVDYLPRIPEAYEVIDKVGISLSEVVSGAKSAKEALAEANKNVFEVMREAGYYQ